ncbi:hypothetical protein NL676_009226 [Syzygium grande]|nr:hypothetical protein NL676_009226 [Syzygium grande]
MVMDADFVHKTWDKWASTYVGSGAGQPLKAALLLHDQASSKPAHPLVSPEIYIPHLAEVEAVRPGNGGPGEGDVVAGTPVLPNPWPSSWLSAEAEAVDIAFLGLLAAAVAKPWADGCWSKRSAQTSEATLGGPPCLTETSGVAHHGRLHRVEGLNDSGTETEEVQRLKRVGEVSGPALG